MAMLNKTKQFRCVDFCNEKRACVKKNPVLLFGGYAFGVRPAGLVCA